MLHVRTERQGGSGARKGVIILVAAALLTFVGFGAHAETPAILGLLMGGVGLATLSGAASSKRELPPLDSGTMEARLRQLEKRLQVTEDELAATSREIASLRETRDFDRQLLAGRKEMPPDDAERTDPS